MSMLQVGENFKISILFVDGKISRNLQNIMTRLPNSEGEENTPIVFNSDDEEESTRVNVTWEDMKVGCLSSILWLYTVNPDFQACGH